VPKHNKPKSVGNDGMLVAVFVGVGLGYLVATKLNLFPNVVFLRLPVGDFVKAVIIGIGAGLGVVFCELFSHST
jgi:hypothetical protein